LSAAAISTGHQHYLCAKTLLCAAVQVSGLSLRALDSCVYLLVRPRVLGSRSSDLLETKEARKYPVEFEGPSRDTDMFEIKLPQGYEVDDLPPPVNADYSFASYHSKAEVDGNTLRYTRTFEVKELSVPLSKVEDLKKLYRIIANDERNTAVLKPAGK
jgi:hypothetical protein